MKKKNLFFSFVCLLITIASASTIAATSTARSTIYFDQNDNIIGQVLIDCQSYRAYAGQDDYNNPNKLEETWGCGGGTVICTGQTPSCFVAGADTSHTETFHSATGRTYQDYCNSSLAHVNTGTPFSGHPDCSPGGAQGPGYVSDFVPYTYGTPASWQ